VPLNQKGDHALAFLPKAHTLVLAVLILSKAFLVLVNHL